LFAAAVIVGIFGSFLASFWEQLAYLFGNKIGTLKAFLGTCFGAFNGFKRLKTALSTA